MKVCIRCKIEKEEDEFHRSSRVKDGRQRYCKACKKILDAEIYGSRDEEWRGRKRDRQREVANRNSSLILEYLQQHPCVDCGESDPLVLEFDHVRGEKKYNVSDLIRRYAGWKTIMAEIDKCDIRCANCHRRATAKRQGMHRYLLLQVLKQ
jgi:hypothetical protein